MITIVSGASSAGKSTFIDNYLLDNEQEKYRDYKILYAYQITSDFLIDPSEDYIFHHNIAHSAMQSVHRGDSKINYRTTDRAWNFINSQKTEKEFFILYCCRKEIMSRVKKRTVIEKHLSTPYNRKLWMRTYKNLNLNRLYLNWIKELENQNYSYQLKDSNNPGYISLAKTNISTRRLWGSSK